MGVPVPPTKLIATNYTSDIQAGTFEVESPYNSQTYKTWWPTQDRSTVAPVPSPTPGTGATSLHLQRWLLTDHIHY